MKRFISLVQKDKTVIGMPQSMWYNDLNLASKTASGWMNNIESKLGKDRAKKIILTWRQQDSYDKAVKLYPLVDNRYGHYYFEHLHFIQVKQMRKNHRIEYHEIIVKFLSDPRKIPDSAFMIGPIQGDVSWSRSDDRVDILFALRNDKESTVKEYRYLF